MRARARANTHTNMHTDSHAFYSAHNNALATCGRTEIHIQTTTHPCLGVIWYHEVPPKENARARVTMYVYIHTNMHTHTCKMYVYVCVYQTDKNLVSCTHTRMHTNLSFCSLWRYLALLDEFTWMHAPALTDACTHTKRMHARKAQTHVCVWIQNLSVS